MKHWSVICYAFAFCTVFAACKDAKTRSTATDTRGNVEDSIFLDIVNKFNVPFVSAVNFDSSALMFYCARTFDTTSLLILREHDSLVHGAFYTMLPTYHRFPNHYAEEKSRLRFFEGYSFVIEYSTWEQIKTEARLLLKNKDSLRNTPGYVDGKRFALYHNMKNCQGTSADDVVFENFDQFLKANFLHRFIKARLPIMYKAKK